MTSFIFGDPDAKGMGTNVIHENLVTGYVGNSVFLDKDITRRAIKQFLDEHLEHPCKILKILKHDDISVDEYKNYVRIVKFLNKKVLQN